MLKYTFKQYLSEGPLKLIDFKEESEKETESEKLDDKSDKHDDSEKETKKDKESHKSKDKKDKEDPDREGVIRTVKNAHLVYKRKDVDGTYTELWEYDISRGFRDEYDIRAAILNGTDINHKTGLSTDEQQSFDIWTCGGRQMLKIKGLEN